MHGVGTTQPPMLFSEMGAACWTSFCTNNMTQSNKATLLRTTDEAALRRHIAKEYSPGAPTLAKMTSCSNDAQTLPTGIKNKSISSEHVTSEQKHFIPEPTNWAWRAGSGVRNGGGKETRKKGERKNGDGGGGQEKEMRERRKAGWRGGLRVCVWAINNFKNARIQQSIWVWSNEGPLGLHSCGYFLGNDQLNYVAPAIMNHNSGPPGQNFGSEFPRLYRNLEKLWPSFAGPQTFKHSNLQFFKLSNFEVPDFHNWEIKNFQKMMPSLFQIGKIKCCILCGWAFV